MKKGLPILARLAVVIATVIVPYLLGKGGASAGLFIKQDYMLMTYISGVVVIVVSGVSYLALYLIAKWVIYGKVK